TAQKPSVPSCGCRYTGAWVRSHAYCDHGWPWRKASGEIRSIVASTASFARPVLGVVGGAPPLGLEQDEHAVVAGRRGLVAGPQLGAEGAGGDAEPVVVGGVAELDRALHGHVGVRQGLALGTHRRMT